MTDEQLQLNPDLMSLWRATILGRNMAGGNVMVDVGSSSVPLANTPDALGKPEKNCGFRPVKNPVPDTISSIKHVPLKPISSSKDNHVDLTLEEIFRDHDLQESSDTLESSMDMCDESTSDLSGIFDDDDAAQQPYASGGGGGGGGPPRSCADSCDSTDSQQRFKPFHEEKWNTRLKELMQYRQEHGDCLVPHTFNPNPQLARWVKRQRRQYKLMLEGRASTMTKERLNILNEIDFVWDSHEAAWQEKLNELNRYRKERGNCLVPSNYKNNPQLATWVKCQRRQYKLYWEGRPSAMTPERIIQLEKIGFEWEIRSSGQSNIARSDYLYLSEAISKMG